MDASGSLGGTVDGVSYTGNYEIQSADVKTLPVVMSVDLDAGDVKLVGITLTYTPYNDSDLKPLETINKEMSPTSSYDGQETLVYTTDFVRLESFSVWLAVCQTSLPTAGGSTNLGFVGFGLLLAGVAVLALSRRGRLALTN